MAEYFEAFVCAYIAGVGIAILEPDNRLFCYAALFIVAAVFLLAVPSKRGTPRKFLLVAVIAAVLASGFWRYSSSVMIAPDDISHYAGTEQDLIVTAGAVPQISINDQGGYDVVMKVNVGGSGNISGAGRLAFTAPERKDIPGYGAVLRLHARIILPPEYKNPGQAGYREYLRQGGMTVLLKTDKVEVIKPCGWLGKLGGLRTDAEITALRNLPPEIAAVYNGILFGGSSGITRQVRNEFRDTGIFHILSVSGSHVSVIAAAVFWLLGMIRLPRGAIALTSIAVTWGYVFLAGAVPAAVRSAIMASFVLFAMVIGNESSPRRSAWLAAALILLVNPLNLLNTGFLLSITATLGIVYFCAPLAVWLGQILPRRLAQASAFTLAAQAGMLPVVVYYFNSLSPLAVIANVLVVPVIDVVLVCGMIAALLPVMPLKLLLVHFGGHLLSGSLLMNSWLAKIPGMRLFFPTLAVWQTVLYYLLLAWSVCGRDIAWRGFRLEKRHAVPLLLAGWLAIVLVRSLLPVPASVHFIDVGEGDATLVITPHRHAVLVDCGGNYMKDENAFDVGESVVVPYLRHYGVRALDAVFLTHGHVDHAGGLAAVQRSMPVGKVFRLQDAGEYRIDGVKFLAEEVVSGEGAGKNGDMLLVRVEYQGKSALLTGDLSARGEQLLLDNHALDTADILKIGHHGSKTSTSDEFLRMVKPRYALISVGENNRYGHPNDGVVGRIERSGAQLFRTDRNGAVRFELSGTIKPEPFRKNRINLKGRE